MMPPLKLNNAPLVEAIFEIRWKLLEQAPGFATDPKYKVLVGRLFERLEQDYPVLETLPTASMPDEMFGYIVQHRFRVAENQWPLVQIGPGLVTLNQTQAYEWEDFETRAHQLLSNLHAAYPDAANALKITRLQLRYIDAIPFEFTNDIFLFMQDTLKITINFSPTLFEDEPVQALPSKFNALFGFPTTNPKGDLSLRFARGVLHEQEALIWETIVQSENENIPPMPDEFQVWLRSAHTVVHNLFFKMIDGSLKERFQ